MQFEFPPITQYLFIDQNSQQQVNNETKNICKQLFIDPNTLILRKAEDFMYSDEPIQNHHFAQKKRDSQYIVNIRLNHYNSRRLKNITAIQKLINKLKSSQNKEDLFEHLSSKKEEQFANSQIKVPELFQSILRNQQQQLYQSFQSLRSNKAFHEQNGFLSPEPLISRKPSSMKRHISSSLKRQSIIDINLVSKNNSQIKIQNVQCDEDEQINNETQKYFDKLEVPLRVPLNMSYSKINRRLAFVTFRTQQQHRVKEKAIENQNYITETRDFILQRNRYDQKRIEIQKRDRDEQIKQKSLEANMNLEKIRLIKRQMEQDKERDLREKHRLIEEENKRQKDLLEQKRRDHQEEMFYRDLQRTYDIEESKSLAQKLHLKSLKQVEDKLLNFQNKVYSNSQRKISAENQKKSKILVQKKHWEEKRMKILNLDKQ